MDISGGIAASLAGRYATALFELTAGDMTAAAPSQFAAVERDFDTLERTRADSPDFAALLTSPRVERAAAVRAVAAIADTLGLEPLVARFLGTLAQNRRLAELPAVIRAYRQLAARHRGEVRAEVTSAHPLANDQVDALKIQLRRRVGSEVALSTRVDPAILGGLVVRVGSRMIDSSIRTRLDTLATAMKG